MPHTPQEDSLTPQDRHKMCAAKRRFRKEGEAISYVIARKARGGMYRGRVYRCPICSGYHIATTPPGQQQAA